MFRSLPKGKTLENFKVQYPDGGIDIEPELKAIVAGLQFSGIGTITESNVQKIFERFEFLQNIGGDLFLRPDENGELQRLQKSDIEKYIGLSIYGVQNLSLPQFLKNQWSVHQGLVRRKQTLKNLS